MHHCKSYKELCIHPEVSWEHSLLCVYYGNVCYCILCTIVYCLLYIVQMCILCKVRFSYLVLLVLPWHRVLYLRISPSVHLCDNTEIWFDLIWFDLIWFDLIWFDLIWFDLIWFETHFAIKLFLILILVIKTWVIKTHYIIKYARKCT